METAVTISIGEVRALAAFIFERMEEAGLSDIRVEQPSYWSVFPSDIFSHSAPMPVLADVADDLSDLRQEADVADSLSRVGVYWHALHHLSGVLSVLASADMRCESRKHSEHSRNINEPGRGIR